MTTKAIVVAEASNNSDGFHYDAQLIERDIPELKESEVLVQMEAVAFNHRDLWIRKNLYPGIGVGAIFGSDGAGTITRSGTANDSLVGRRVFLTPSRGWDKDPVGPEESFTVIGGVKGPNTGGTFAEYVVVERSEVIEIPTHLDFEHAAAWPLAGATAWRVINYQAGVQKGHNVLLTGVGGGVAVIALQLLVALGANVYVTSGSNEKIKRAIELGAKAGFNYKEDTWPKELAQVLKQNNGMLDSVIDSAGGDILRLTSKLLKQGGVVVCYGMTSTPQIVFTMREVLKNVHLKGSAMASKRELVEATNFVAEHQITPIVSTVFEGLDSSHKGFDILKTGSQFGKIVVRIRPNSKL